MTELALQVSPLPGASARPATRHGLAGLDAIRELLQPRAVFRFRDLAVEGIAFHSGEVRPGFVFFAISGTRADGATFVDEAIRRGAIAVVSEQMLDLPSVPLLVVDDARQALADTACAWMRHPSATLDCIGVTGTNGKTTAAHLIWHCLHEDGRSAGLLGTVGYEMRGRRRGAPTTTPDALTLQGLLREMSDASVQSCVMEVSSHALVQERVRGVDFDVAAFLNLSQDHLDYHGSMGEYGKAKARLFAMLRPGAVAVLPAFGPAAKTMRDACGSGVEVLTWARGSRDAVFAATDLRPRLDGTEFRLWMPHGHVDLFLGLPGLHNVDNALAAATTAYALGVSELGIAWALESARPVRGRLEEIVVHGPRRTAAPRVFVDYAHTPDALDKTCRTLRDLGSGPLTVVFGCGGERDHGKRPLMVRSVARYADTAILTSDNPRHESPEAILDEMEAGIPANSRTRFFRVIDRADAIARAVAGTPADGTVLVAGKGHETTQIIGDDMRPFDDAAVAREVLRGTGGGRRW